MPVAVSNAREVYFNRDIRCYLVSYQKHKWKLSHLLADDIVNTEFFGKNTQKEPK